MCICTCVCVWLTCVCVCLYAYVPVSQEVKVNLKNLRPPVEGALARREEVVAIATPAESTRVQETALLLNTNWDKVNKLYLDRLRYVPGIMGIYWGHTGVTNSGQEGLGQQVKTN